MSKVLIAYICIDCGKTPPEDYMSMICPHCRGRIRGSGPGVTGTRDNFGVGMAFTDDESGKTIDNWKSWEKAGFRKPLEVTNDHVVKEKVKEKISKINKNK